MIDIKSLFDVRISNVLSSALPQVYLGSTKNRSSNYKTLMWAYQHWCWRKKRKAKESTNHRKRTYRRTDVLVLPLDGLNILTSLPTLEERSVELPSIRPLRDIAQTKSRLIFQEPTVYQTWRDKETNHRYYSHQQFNSYLNTWCFNSHSLTLFSKHRVIQIALKVRISHFDDLLEA